MDSEQFDVVMHENRKFPPSEEFQKQATISGMDEYKALYKKSIEDPETFWAEAADELHWFKKWDRVLDDTEKPWFKWFSGGKTNMSYNCLDRQIESGNGNKAALIWEGEPGDSRTLTYNDLHREVCKFANALKTMGIKKGDRVAIYLPMIPELAISLLACARIGAVHSVIFAGFSAEAIRDRVLDSETCLVITGDGSWRRGKPLLLKEIVDKGIEGVDCVDNVIVVQRPAETAFACDMKEGRDSWYHTIVADEPEECPAEELDAEDMLFLLYTSGTTGKPKGIIHTVGGYMVYTYLTFKYVFDIKPDDIYFCTADIGWITGHSYLVYGPLANGASCIMYEGAPNSPDNGRFWSIVEKYKATIFYTAPTAIRAFMKWGEQWPDTHDLSSLRLLGTVGESINPEAWIWYNRVIGGERCPIIDTWWQTETGGVMLAPLPGAIPTKPGCATVPFFGIDLSVVTLSGEEAEAGLLTIRKPWPGITRGIYGDQERYKSTYWSNWGGKWYFPGDGAKRDEDGYIWVLGRVDDVVNVSGHRIGTAELESIFVEHFSVAESAVIGVKHEIKGQGLVAFVTLKEGIDTTNDLKMELFGMIEKQIGKFARPEKIVFTPDLPKTRSGKIMRRLLRDIAEDREVGNATTLADPSVVEDLQRQFAEE